MEKIIKLSLLRLKNNFLRYFLVYVLGILAVIALTLVLGLVAGLFYGLFWFLGKNVILATILITLFSFGAILAFIYLSSWLSLAQISAITNDQLKDVTDSFKKTRGMIWSYVGFFLLSALFGFGLFYLNILLFIPMFVWAIWGTFSVFAFLDNHRGGLMPLWYSKAKIKGHFGKVFLYYAVLYIALVVLSTLFIQMDSRFNFANGILWFLATPFMMSFSYELYQDLPEPKSVAKPKVWIGLAVFGWLLYIGLFIFSLSSLGSVKLPLDKRLPQKQFQNWGNLKLN